MCPFCIGAAAWAAAGVVSAGGLGVLAAFVHRPRPDARSDSDAPAVDAAPSSERASRS